MNNICASTGTFWRPFLKTCIFHAFTWYTQLKKQAEMWGVTEGRMCDKVSQPDSNQWVFICTCPRPIGHHDALGVLPDDWLLQTIDSKSEGSSVEGSYYSEQCFRVMQGWGGTTQNGLVPSREALTCHVVYIVCLNLFWHWFVGMLSC